MNTPFEIKNNPDSGAIVIKSEGDMNAIARADEIVKAVYRTLPKNRVFSGGVSKDDVDKAQAIAEELDSMALYADRCYTPEEYEGLLNQLELDTEKDQLPSHVRPEAIKEFTDFVSKMSSKDLREIVTDAKTKQQAIKALVASFSSVKPTRLGRQARASFGRLKLARGKLNYAHERQLKSEGA